MFRKVSLWFVFLVTFSFSESLNFPGSSEFNRENYISYLKSSIISATNSSSNDLFDLFAENGKFKYCFNQNCFDHKIPLRSFIGNWGRLSERNSRKMTIIEYYFGNDNRYLYIRCLWNINFRNKQNSFFEQFAIIYFNLNGKIKLFSGWCHPSTNDYFMNLLSIKREGYLHASNSEEAEAKYEKEYQKERQKKLKLKKDKIKKEQMEKELKDKIKNEL